MPFGFIMFVISIFFGESLNHNLNPHFTFITVVVPYEVTFYTGDVNKAGTDANVKLTVFGDGGSSTEQVTDPISYYIYL